MDVEDSGAPERVDHLTLPGQVSALTVVANRLYVATQPHNVVRIYALTEEQSPELLGELDVGGKVEAMRLQGSLLHVAEHATKKGWQGCTSGHYCPRGMQVEVYDVSDPAAVTFVDTYDGEEHPAVHLRAYGRYALVRQHSGFRVYEVVPAQ